MYTPEGARKILNEEYPIEIRQKFLPAVRLAYKMVKDLKDDKEWIAWIGSEDLLVHLRIYAVEFMISRLVDKGELPDSFRYRIARNVADNCNHLELLSRRSILTISHVHRPKQVPRYADFRLNLGISNQLLLAPEFADLVRHPGDKFFALLTHGKGEDAPGFVNIGIPNGHVRSWADRINLMKEPQYVDNISRQEEIPDPTELMDFKLKIEGDLKSDG